MYIIYFIFCLYLFQVCAADGTSIKDDNNDVAKRSRISEGIQSIVSRLRGSLAKETDLNEKNIKPVELNVYCNEEAPETALHAAVRNGHKDVVIALLENGSDPNLLTLQPSADYKVYCLYMQNSKIVKCIYIFHLNSKRMMIPEKLVFLH